MCDEVIGSVKFEMVRLKNDDGSDNLRFFDMCPRRVSCAHATGVRAELYRGVPVDGMKNGRTLSSQRSTVLSEIVRNGCSGRGELLERIGYFERLPVPRVAVFHFDRAPGRESRPDRFPCGQADRSSLDRAPERDVRAVGQLD